MSRRDAPAHALPPSPPEHRPSDPPLTVRWHSKTGLAVEGLRFGTILLLLGYAGVIWQGGGRAAASLTSLTAALESTADTLRKASSDAAEARAGVNRVEQAQAEVRDRLVRIESDVGALRQDLRAACAQRSSRP